MDSLDEFQLFENMLQKGVEEPSKKERMLDKPANSSIVNNNNGETSGPAIYNYQDLVQQELNNHPGVCNNQEQLAMINRIVRKVEAKERRRLGQKIDQLKENQKEVTFLLSQNLSRKNDTSRNSDESTMGLINLSDTSDIINQGGYRDQLRKLQDERDDYQSENERLKKVIEELKATTPKTTSSQSSNNSSLFHGLLDWALVEEPQVSNEVKDHVSFEDGLNVDNSQYNRLLLVLSDNIKSIIENNDYIDKILNDLEPKNNNNNPINVLYRTADELYPQGYNSFEDNNNSLLSEMNIELAEDDLTHPSMFITTNQDVSINCSSNEIEEDVVHVATRKLKKAIVSAMQELMTREEKCKQMEELLHQSQAELQTESEQIDELSRQLLDKERLVDSLEGERNQLSEQLTNHAVMKVENEKLKMKVEEFERDHDKFVAELKRLNDEKALFEKGLPNLQQGLLVRNESLGRDIQQLQGERLGLMKRIDDLMAEVEMLRSEKQQLLSTTTDENEELLTQVNSKEKNLVSLKRFIEEQTQERELEREEFNKELETLKENVKEKDKLEAKLKSTINKLESHQAMLTEEKAAFEVELEEVNVKNKETNVKLAEQNIIIKRLEEDIDRFQHVEKELKQRLQEISAAFNWKLNDQTNLNTLIDCVVQLIESNKPTDTSPIVYDIQNSENVPTIPTSPTEDSVFLIIKKMDDRINALNKNLDELILSNKQLKNELDAKEALMKQLGSKHKHEKEMLEKNLEQMTKTIELMREEVNQTHLKNGELKVRLESSVDADEVKQITNNLQSKLNAEKQQRDALSVKLEQSTRYNHELSETIESYKSELKSYKELVKGLENEAQALNVYKAKLEQSTDEIERLRTQVTNKSQDLKKSEDNRHLLNSMIMSLNKEKELIYQQLKASNDSTNKIANYDKNMEQLKLQNKALSDKVLYYELEIQNLKKKIMLLEQENEKLKLENHRLLRQNNEMTATVTMMFDSPTEVDKVDAAPGTNNKNNAGQLANISSSNLLALKVKRLMTQKNALIYQKRYLTNMLSGFQVAENTTLELFADLNDNQESITKLRGKQRWRSVVYAVIATYRIRHCVKIWQCRKKILLVNKAAQSIAQPPYNIPVPPKRVPQEMNMNIVSDNNLIRQPISNKAIICNLKDYVDRLHVVHETLGIHTSKI